MGSCFSYPAKRAPHRPIDVHHEQPMMVQVDKAIARRGPIPIAGRYSCSKKLEDEYKIESKVLGSGMSGPVLLATSKRDSRQYAVKSFKKKGLASKQRHELQSEVEVYMTLDHPHVAKLEMVYETDEKLHLVMEFMEGGELYDRLAARKRYTEEDAAEATSQMLLAVSYLHGHQIAHRDLKLENFLYEKKDSDILKLIDFGFAKFWDPTTTMSQSCGSLHYVAPEVLAHSYTTQADMWSIGILVYMLLTGVPLFHGSDEDILRSIKAGKIRFSTRFYKLSAEAQDFVKAVLVKDPDKRLDAPSALEHDWIKGAKLNKETHIEPEIVTSLRKFAHASHFKRAVLSMMAWSLSADDIAELRSQFLMLDVQNRGTITHEELKRILEDKFHIDSNEARQLFQSLDTDNNDQVEYTEFLAATMMGSVKAQEDVLRKTFSRFDCDGSGLISTSDLRSVLGDAFEGTEIEELIREADTSGDGKIDYDEFIAYFHKQDAEEAEEPVKLERANRKRKTTQKLKVVIDRLVESEAEVEEQSEQLAQSSAISSGNLSTKRQSTGGLPTPLQRRLVGDDVADQPRLPALLGSQGARDPKVKV